MNAWLFFLVAFLVVLIVFVIWYTCENDLVTAKPVLVTELYNFPASDHNRVFALPVAAGATVSGLERVAHVERTKSRHYFYLPKEQEYNIRVEQQSRGVVFMKSV